MRKKKTNKKFTPTFWIKNEGRSIIVFDDLFAPELVRALGVMFSGLDYQRRPSFDNELSIAFEEEVFKSIPAIFETCEALKKKFYKKMSAKLSPQIFNFAFAASMRYGDHTLIHQDWPCEDCLTFMYYGNLHWDPLWGGETLFYNNDKDTIFASQPRVGRLVMFNAHLFHKGGIPTRDCPSARYGMSIFYRCKKHSNPPKAKVIEEKKPGSNENKT